MKGQPYHLAPAAAALILSMSFNTPLAGTASLSTMGADLSGSGWSEAILGPDSKIYAVPYTASDLLVIDPVAGTASRRSIDGIGPTSLGKWVMGDIVGNKIYGIPYGSQDIILVELLR